jgi:hypothetical protein
MIVFIFINYHDSSVFFADVAKKLIERESKNRETVSTPRNRVFASNETRRNEPHRVGEKPVVSSGLDPDPLLRRHRARPPARSCLRKTHRARSCGEVRRELYVEGEGVAGKGGGERERELAGVPARRPALSRKQRGHRRGLCLRLPRSRPPSGCAPSSSNFVAATGHRAGAGQSPSSRPPSGRERGAFVTATERVPVTERTREFPSAHGLGCARSPAGGRCSQPAKPFLDPWRGCRHVHCVLI